MKRYVSLAGAMLLGTVLAQEKKSAAAVVKAETQFKEAAPVVLEGTKPVYRSEATSFTPDVARRSKSPGNVERISKKSPNAAVVAEDRATSKATSKGTSFNKVEINDAASSVTTEIGRAHV